MSRAGEPDDEGVPDRTVDPNDPEPQYADIDNPTDEECLAHIEWVKRNLDAMFRRGVECPFDDGDEE
jgi:hypothetical protein